MIKVGLRIWVKDTNISNISKCTFSGHHLQAICNKIAKSICHLLWVKNSMRRVAVRLVEPGVYKPNVEGNHDNPMVSNHLAMSH